MITPLLLISLAFSSEVSETGEENKKLVHSLIAANVVMHFIDVSETQWLMGHNAGSGERRYKEVNPLMKPFAKNPVTMAVVKGSFAAAQSYIFIKYHKTKKKFVIIGTIISTALTGIADYINYRHYKNAIR